MSQASHNTMAFENDHSLLLETEVQLVVSYSIIEVYIVFKTLLMLVTSQLAIAGQLVREIHLQRIGLFLGSGE